MFRPPTDPYRHTRYGGSRALLPPHTYIHTWCSQLESTPHLRCVCCVACICCVRFTYESNAPPRPWRDCSQHVGARADRSALPFNLDIDQDAGAPPQLAKSERGSSDLSTFCWIVPADAYGVLIATLARAVRDRCLSDVDFSTFFDAVCASYNDFLFGPKSGECSLQRILTRMERK